MLIRQETRNDYDEVYKLVKEAFTSAEYTDGNEQELVTALRKNKKAFIPELSLVAEFDKEIVGHILFTKIKVGDDTVLALAPLSVKPNYQKKGIGTALILAGHQIAQRLGYTHCIVLGSETYYPKAGYLPAEEFNILMPAGFPPQNYMAIQLLPHAQPIHGEVSYAKEFGL